MEVIIGK